MPAMRVCGPRAGQQTKDLGNELGTEGSKKSVFRANKRNAFGNVTRQRNKSEIYINCPQINLVSRVNRFGANGFHEQFS